MSLAKHIKEHLKLQSQLTQQVFTFASVVSFSINGVSGAGTDYQVQLYVADSISAYDKGVGADLYARGMAVAFDYANSGDVRFYTADGVSVPFYVASYSANVAEIWIKCPLDLDSNQNLYMVVLGDANAANVSNIESTFILGADFKGAQAVSSDQWDSSKYGNLTILANGARFNNDSNQYQLESLLEVGDETEVIFQGRQGDCSAAGQHTNLVGFEDAIYFFNDGDLTSESQIGVGDFDSPALTGFGSETLYTGFNDIQVARNNGVGRVIARNNLSQAVTVNIASGVPTGNAKIWASSNYNTLPVIASRVMVKKYVGVTEPAFNQIESFYAPHTHAGESLTPIDIDMSGQITCRQGGPGYGAFGLNIDCSEGSDDEDCHGVLMTSRSTDPSATNHIVNFRFAVNELSRWTIKKDSDVESGSNAGSSLMFKTHTDAGGNLHESVFTLFRDGRISFPEIDNNVPSSASDTGEKGQIAWDTDYIYICTATNTWKRVAIATW